MPTASTNATTLNDAHTLLGEWRAFSPSDHLTWRTLIANRRPALEHQAHPMFLDGLRALDLESDRIPDMQRLNRRLSSLTGWRAVPVPGLIESRLFFELLAQRMFPAGNFIRDPADLGYTPAPDIFHDVFGHLPFIVDRHYADFTQRLGALAAASSGGKALDRFERVYWFTVEFGLVHTPRGLRICGGGLMSSNDESAHVFTAAVSKRPFDVARMARHPYRNDIMQEEVYVAPSMRHVYACLDSLAAAQLA